MFATNGLTQKLLTYPAQNAHFPLEESVELPLLFSGSSSQLGVLIWQEWHNKLICVGKIYVVERGKPCSCFGINKFIQ